MPDDVTNRFNRITYDPAKRVLDIAGSAIGLLVLSPVMAVTAVLVAVNLGRPVIFRQLRPGLHSEVFMLYKFRSMLTADPKKHDQLDADRLTRFGQILRATSLDELPSLVNVLKGDMSVVGPRPLLVEYLDRYTPEQARRHDVRPGITGLAQVNGRNLLSWEDKFDWDVDYVQKRSFGLDARILGATVAAVFRRSGISSQGHATSPKFRGKSEEG